METLTHECTSMGSATTAAAALLVVDARLRFDDDAGGGVGVAIAAFMSLLAEVLVPSLTFDVSDDDARFFDAYYIYNMDNEWVLLISYAVYDLPFSRSRHFSCQYSPH